MGDRIAIALAQLNPHLGQIERNVAGILAARAAAAAQAADLVLTAELSVCGYPPQDLLARRAFIEACQAGVGRLAEATADGGPALVVGTPWAEDGVLYNAALLLDGGRVAMKRFKHELPNYGVFDEKRHFAPGPAPGPMAFRGFRIGLMICEDCWFPAVSETLAESGADLLVAINASPFEAEKQHLRETVAQARVAETGLPLIFLNQVGGQDALVFDGASFVLSADRAPAVRMRGFTSELCITRWARSAGGVVCESQSAGPELPRLEKIYRAMMLGLGDYVTKNGFPGVLLGLSGGIDSALSAAVAVDALGADRVRAVMLPGPFTQEISLEDADMIAARLGIRCTTIPIAPALGAFDAMLKPIFAGHPPDITEENLQARARGAALMAISNKFGDLLLTTGNKSEVSVGYATLYGDMCGGYSVLKDVYKTTVFELARWRNAYRPEAALGPPEAVMPERVITRPPSAELRANQTDQDSLPPYGTLDAVLGRLIEGNQSVDEVVAAGFDRSMVLGIARLVDRAEYKRRQAAPGVKISSRAFGCDRRYPITNGFTGLDA